LKNLLVCFIALACLAGCSERHNDRNWTVEHSKKAMAKAKADSAAFEKLSKTDVKRMKNIDRKIKDAQRSFSSNNAKLKRLHGSACRIWGDDKLAESRRDNIQEKMDATMDDNSRLKRKIKKLTSEKAAILNQATPSCFPGETFIQTKNGKLKPIRQIKAGDMVMAFDIGTQTNVPRKVLDTYKDNNNHYYLINGSVKATAYERFLTPNGWKQVMHLKKGDTVQTNQGMETIDSLIIKNGVLEVYNLQVEESHTFYVAGHGGKLYIVHNYGSSGGSSSK
jgi:hypothetical protein